MTANPIRTASEPEVGATHLAEAPAVTTTKPGGALVELRGLHRRFGSTLALDGLSLTMAPGELVALLGPSGCGKTTALRVLAGFERPDSGEVFVDGENLSRLPAQRRGMGMVFQSYSLFPTMTARDNVAFGLRVRRQATASRRRAADALLDIVGLAPQASQYPHQLSGGQQQRVALARALAIEPRVLLLDEPLSALDAKVRLQLRDLIRSVQLRLGTTTLFVTHDQEEALSMADRVGVMRQGTLEQIAPPDELYAHPATAFVAEFVGTMNHLPAVLTPDGAHVLGRTVNVRDRADRQSGDRVSALIRPEGLALTPARSGAGIVSGKTFLGSVTRVLVMLSQEVSVRVDVPSMSAGSLALGDPVDVTVTADSVLITDGP
ncbi:MAG TPA: ABC transporter ATP-binding protein [Frankiaceae bacterium]|jgi:putative spermidine/putrescine transport system ATP-binding protein|nr:ABC transporter ATP-binding protein [Frankiaceae bacterium]